MIIATYNKREHLLKDSQDLSESVTYQLGNLQGALALMRYDINDSLEKDECIQRSWVDSLSVISFVLEKLEMDAEKLTDKLIELQKLKGSVTDNGK